jgi:amino acid adenylation domain-containing protein
VSCDSLSFPSSFVEFPQTAIELSIPLRFEKIVDLYPDHLAIKANRQELTYANFNRSVNRLARAVVDQSSADAAIAILLEQDAAAMVAIFAVLKAARYFVPLDVSLPKSRLLYMLEDSQAELLITNAEFYSFARAEFGDKTRVINIDAHDASFGTENLGFEIGPEHLSCVLYTSGTTGSPKGVVHTHRNELHNVMHHTNSLHLNAKDRLTLLGSYSTGQGLQDLYCALLNGATLYPWNLKSAGLGGIAKWLEEERITVYHSAATVYRHVCKHLSTQYGLPDLRIVRLGSEAVTWKDFDLYKNHFADHCVFVNALSSSETKTISQCILTKAAQITGLIPIGYPVPDTEILLLDESGREVGLAEIGEITVDSRYLFTGYWRNSALTDATFGRDKGVSNRRIFRTGEWGRMSADGCLQHLGRRDSRVKIRGYRIETFEIELALLGNPVVEQTMIECRESASGDTYLIAYIVPARTVSVSEIRRFLKDRIPDYMIPSSFIFLDSFPITPNGKIDRKALPEPNKARPLLDVQFIEPTGAIEEVLASIWRDVLEIDEIGTQDNFFDIGGNSLTAMQVVAQVENQFQISLSLQRFFECPTIASFAHDVISAAPAVTKVGEVAVGPLGRKDNLPLSSGQQRLWFLDQWEPGNIAYNVCEAHRVRGRPDSALLEQSLNAVIERHEILRTRFVGVNGDPVQKVAPAVYLEVAKRDLGEVSEVERDECIRALAREEGRRPFDLSSGPLLRATLVRFADNDYLLLFILHQIICDGWSMQIFLREFWSFYEAFSRRSVPCLSPLPLQYADFALWQQTLLKDDLKTDLLFWKMQLAGNSSVLNLPADHPRPKFRSFRGGKVFFTVSQSLTSSLNMLSRREGVTLFMTSLASFQALLFRFTGDPDVAVGFPIADRNWSGTSKLIGFFVNTVVARTDLSGEPTFRALLARVRRVCFDAFSHQRLPFERLVQELQLKRDSSHNPLFQVMFAFHNIPLFKLDVPDLRTTPEPVDSGTAKFDLTLSLIERDKQLVGFFEYSKDLFERATIERIAGNFQTLLESLVSAPDAVISTVPLIGSDESHQLTVKWNDTAAEYPREACVHELFSAQVEKTPDSIAYELGSGKLTFRELNRRANRLAHHLRELGIRPDEVVGIYLERSFETIIGTLGILKTGAAYLPLDTLYPDERIEYMLQDATVRVLITRSKFISRLHHYAGALVCVEDWECQAGVSDEELENQTSADGAAYVIYTSGSTGVPKGVIGLHRGIVNRLAWMWKEYPFATGEKGSFKTSPSFVDSVAEMFGGLLQGVTTTLIQDHDTSDPERLVSILAEKEVTRVVTVPSLLEAVLETVPNLQNRLRNLRCWSSSGEPLQKNTVARFRESLPNAVLINLYGASEVSADVTFCEPLNEMFRGRIPIGRPIANTQIYIVDPYLQPLPIGVSGELCVGGAGLARGYLNRPELTAEKFIPNPFSDQASSRLYRTGDLARYRPDGNIEFLGRMDNQVKIRGHRIEFGEIEFALNQHPAVKESVVISSLASSPRQVEAKVGVAPSANGKQEGAPLSLGSSLEEEEGSESHHKLIAYLTPNAEKPSATELRRFLSHKLPEYMIPSAFVVLDALPLTLNGKIDRSKLPPADGARPEIDQSFVEPRSEIEELVTQIWCELLKCDRIGVHDNFFELGGHSLLATRVVARLRSNFGVDLPLRKLFELPTIAGLTEYIDRLRCSSAGTSIPPIVPVDRNQPLPLSFSQRRLWYLQRVDPNLSAYNIPAAFRIRGDLDSSTLEQALTDVIARHEILRSCIKEVDGQPLQETAPNLGMRLPVTELTQLSNEQAENEANRLFHADARQLYDLGTAPLVRARLIKLSIDVHILIFNFHHIIADGSSLTIFYRELGQFYDAACEAKKLSLPALPVQYVDFAAWQQEWLSSDGFRVELAYWKRQLAELPPPVELPTDFARPSSVSRPGARMTRQLSEKSTASLKKFSRQHGATVFMTLFATFNVLLSRMTGMEDIIVGSTIAGRNRVETHGLIGFFINGLPLRTDLSGNPSFSTLLQRVREICLDAYAHQDMPFEKLVQELRPPRDPGHNPIFDILFNVADISERVLALNGCDVIKLDSPAPEAKFDIVLHAPETDGRIDLAAVYNTSVFREARIALLLEQWATLLEQVTRNPELPISEISLVTDSSRALLPDPTEVLDNDWEGAIHEILADQARRSPNSVAVIDPQENWTYREIDEATNRFTNALINAGIQPKDTVAVYAERNASLVIAIFSVLKAGAAFLILDSAYPPARTIQYLRAAQPKGWLQLSSIDEDDELANYLDTLNLHCRMKIPDAKDELLQSLASFADSAPDIRVDAEDPAYIAFTSGSTGEAKAVLSRHGPITHFLPWQNQAFELYAGDRFALLSGLAYNHLHRDVFTPLAMGASLFIPRPEIPREPGPLRNWLRANGISVLHLTPALGQLLLTAAAQPLPDVRRVFFGGDVLTWGEVARIRELAPNATIGCFYGATETQRAVGYYGISRDFTVPTTYANRPVPLGCGIEDVQLLVLNKKRALAGIGELGELYVRSPHLAEGYLNDDERTREVFIANPFTDDVEDRLYKTGELARYLPDGNVEWAGRDDRRVNIRGFRVELEEIESVLKQHSAVKDAAVTLREFADDASANPKFKTCTEQSRSIENLKSDRRLVAYLVADENAQSLSDLLYGYVSSRLPDYMVPSHFMTIEQLPLNPNGKVDYQALPPVEMAGEEFSIVPLAPQNEIERRLSDILAQVLGRDHVGIDQNFFRIGGHSLLAAQAVARIREAFEVALDLRTFLESPTIKALAKEIDFRIKPADTTPGSEDKDREEIEL